MNNLPDRRTQTALFERADRPGLIFRPSIRQTNAQSFQIVGYRDDETVVPWGFWGGVFAVVVMAVVVLYQGLTGLWDAAQLLEAVAALGVGLLVLKFGARSSLKPEPCAEIDLARGTLRLLSSDASIALPEVRLEDLDEIVFGMTKYPVSTERDAVKVEAFSLLVRHASDTLLPLVEASPDKDVLYAAARVVSQATGLPITHVGIGVK